MKDMKKRALLLFLVLLLLALGACRESATDTETETADGADDNDGTTDDDGTSDETPEDVNANEAAFVQTGEHEESVKLLGTGGAEPATVVVELGDLVTLEIFSERLQTTQIYNEDLMVDAMVGRGETITVTIEANEENIFYITDKITGDQLFKFMVAGQSFG